MASRPHSDVVAMSVKCQPQFTLSKNPHHCGGFFISRTRVFMEGRIELLQYFHEQSICDNYHRYGNIGDRAMTYEG